MATCLFCAAPARWAHAKGAHRHGALAKKGALQSARLPGGGRKAARQTEKGGCTWAASNLRPVGGRATGNWKLAASNWQAAEATAEETGAPLAAEREGAAQVCSQRNECAMSMAVAKAKAKGCALQIESESLERLCNPYGAPLALPPARRHTGTHTAGLPARLPGGAEHALSCAAASCWPHLENRLGGRLTAFGRASASLCTLCASLCSSICASSIGAV